MSKTLQDLTLKNSFMFAAVMTDAENCKALLERVLEIEIDHVVVDKEKSFVYHPEYKSVRLDVYAKDEEGSHFNVEMQVAKKEIVKRARYYHSQLDMNILLAGMDYENLPNMSPSPSRRRWRLLRPRGLCRHRPGWRWWQRWRRPRSGEGEMRKKCAYLCKCFVFLLKGCKYSVNSWIIYGRQLIFIAEKRGELRKNNLTLPR